MKWKGTSKTPAAYHLFMMNEKYDILSEDKSQLFHQLVATLLYLCSNTRQYPDGGGLSMYKSQEAKQGLI